MSLLQDILYNFHDSKIFAKVSYRYLKFDQKFDRDVSEAVQLTVLELCHSFVQNWGPEPTKKFPLQI